MEKALYTLKKFLFQNEFKLTLNEHNAFRDLCIFIVRNIWWYLTPEVTTLAFFDDNISLKTKAKMLKQ
jgi:hypothetical protein